MGNYQDYLKQTNPLRELDPGMNRAHMFGNPFKLAKDQVCAYILLFKLSNLQRRMEKAVFSMSRFCGEIMCSKPKIFLAFLSNLLCFSFSL